jgi:hypothetical protein
MEVCATLLSALTGNIIYWWIRGIDRRLILHHHKVDKTGNSQYGNGDNTECHDTFSPRGSSTLFLAPTLFFSPSFLSGLLMYVLFTHRSSPTFQMNTVW